MGAKESNIFKSCQIRASKLGGRLWRQQSGQGWVGRSIIIKELDRVDVFPGDVVIRKARPFHAGFPGISDGGGYCMVTITAEMVGQSLPVLLQVETKADGAVTDEQRKFIAHVRSVGGRAGIARSADDMERIVAGELVD